MFDPTLYQNGRPPHCDELVVHAPGACEFCDDFASLAQQQRIRDNINFTGEGNPNKQPCPAEQRRALSTINRWGGNVAQPRNKPLEGTSGCPKCGDPGRWINLALICAEHGAFG